MKPFADYYQGKKVFITGHTGFKGSWLATWALELGAEVIGYSSYLPSRPCNFNVLGLEKKITHIEGDVRDLKTLKSSLAKHRPHIVFHMAAQPLVRKSYNDPLLTFETNLGGMVNVLEVLREREDVEAAVMITSDKCYHNVEWEWGYRENDRLGGEDPYSASKACAEIAAHAYMGSFFKGNKKAAAVGTARAGNVIGGGDWADDRIVPDCVRAVTEGRYLEIRNPRATRPWQHVLEPLSGYLWLAVHLAKKRELSGEAFNFGPLSDVNRAVEELLMEMRKNWSDISWENTGGDSGKKEAGLLKLSCDKALHHLNWHAVLSFEETVEMTTAWYRGFYGKGEDIYLFTQKQIDFYVEKAIGANLPWAKGEDLK